MLITYFDSPHDPAVLHAFAALHVITFPLKGYFFLQRTAALPGLHGLTAEHGCLLMLLRRLVELPGLKEQTQRRQTKTGTNQKSSQAGRDEEEAVDLIPRAGARSAPPGPAAADTSHLPLQ